MRPAAVGAEKLSDGDGRVGEQSGRSTETRGCAELGVPPEELTAAWRSASGGGFDVAAGLA